MFETELPILGGAQPAFRRPMGRRCIAAGPLTTGKLGAEPAVLVGLDPNPMNSGELDRIMTIMRTLWLRVQD